MLCGCCKAASKDGSGAEDAGKYQLNAVRFYEVEDAIGVTAPTDIAETAKNFTIDHFDTYTDPAGKVYALILGSDYDSLNGLEVYDTIDLTNLPVRVDNEEGDPTEHLAILAQTPEAYMKLGAGTFPTTAVDAYVAADLYELTAGLNLPVQVTVQNTGTTAVNDVTVRMGGAEKRFTGLDLLPGQRATLTVDYLVPETVQDVPYSVSANNDSGDPASGVLVLNRPDVGISGMKLLREGDETRDIQVTLSNISGIPLAGSGKTVKLTFYRRRPA